MEGPSSNPIVIVISIKASFMAYGVIKSISMSAFIEGGLVA
jgi:hypothetical protein